ncbi:uncharacterized protein C1orf127 homolog [Hyla sarda]|uniref:uncharacterized protein C1orf127 homolog n=1 Tax=Hyla sarda TaxID=327740 RepID=UPI0024C43205|nr:uncharacterized protein C1orf127 homolog [Hyla sarda]
MELWVPRRQMDGLLLWLSRVMRFPVSLSSLDRSNHLISRCRYALDMDSDGNFIFRVHYSACNVQTQNGFHVLEIHMVKKTSPGKGRSDRYHMRCPAMTAAMGRETVRCDPNYVQVSRPMPLENADNQNWFLLFRGDLVVSVEDASLIGMEVEINKSHITVKGLRDHLLSPKEFLDRKTAVLPLWIGDGFYAYSLEASCPLVAQTPGEEVIVHIPKQRMGLVKRGSYMTETLTLRNIVVRRHIDVTVTENKHFVMVNVNPGVLQTQDCTTPNNTRGIQVFYSIDLVLEFAEIAYPMNWTLENYYECAVLTQDTAQQEILFNNNEELESSVNKTVEEDGVPSHRSHHMTRAALPANDSVKTTGAFIEGSGEHLDIDISGSGDHQAVTSDQIIAATNILNLLSSAPSRLQDSKTLDDHLSNSTTIDEAKNMRVSSKVSSTLTTTTLFNVTGAKNKQNNKKTSKNEQLKWTTRQVIEHGGSVVKQEDFTKPKKSQIIPSSELIPNRDTDLWEVLIDDNILERLGETARDGWISRKYRHHPPRSETGSKVREKTMDETSVPPERRQKRPTRDLQHMEEDYTLPSRHVDWTKVHEDMLYDTSDIETIGSAEQLIVEK